MVNNWHLFVSGSAVDLLAMTVHPAAAPSVRLELFASASATPRSSRRSSPEYHDGEPSNCRLCHTDTVAEPGGRRKSSRGSRITILNTACRPAQGSICLRVGPGIGLRQSVRFIAVRSFQGRRAVCAHGLQGPVPAVQLCYGPSSRQTT